MGLFPLWEFFLDNWPSGHPHRTSHIWVPGRPSEIKATGLILTAPPIEWRGHSLEEMWTQFHENSQAGRVESKSSSLDFAVVHQFKRHLQTTEHTNCQEYPESIATSQSAKVTNFKTLWVSICLQNVRLTPYKQNSGMREKDSFTIKSNKRTSS